MPFTRTELGALDLNLLHTLVVLVEERSTIAAGKRLGLAQSTVSGTLQKLRDAADGVVSAVCHDPAGLGAATRQDRQQLATGLRVNGFEHAEEAAADLTEAMPLLLETCFRDLGAHFESTDKFQSQAVRDGRLGPGQNPTSVQAIVNLMLDAPADGATLAAHWDSAKGQVLRRPIRLEPPGSH